MSFAIAESAFSARLKPQIPAGKNSELGPWHIVVRPICSIHVSGYEPNWIQKRNILIIPRPRRHIAERSAVLLIRVKTIAEFCQHCSSFRTGYCSRRSECAVLISVDICVIICSVNIALRFLKLQTIFLSNSPHIGGRQLSQRNVVIIVNKLVITA